LDLLPDSRTRAGTDGKRLQMPNRTIATWVPIYCANCGVSGGRVPEENCSFAFYLCNGCVERWGTIAGTYQMPDEVFWQKVRDQQNEQYGRQLGVFEMSEAMKDGHNTLGKLLREQPR